MSERILFVDDEPNVLSAYRRALRKRFQFDTAQSGEEGLGAIESNAPYAVVVSDLKMPGMTGIELLSCIRERFPDTVRVMVTGFADLQAAVSAVNEGNIFRFLTKPVEQDVLVGALEASLDQYRLITAERELLENTLSGSVKVMADVLSLVNPGAFSRASRVRRYVRHITTELGLSSSWMFDVAALLSHIGCVALPPDTLQKVCAGQELSDAEQKMFDAHPRVAHDLLVHIPRMEAVAQIIARQMEDFEPNSYAEDPRDRDVVILGAQILRTALGFDRLLMLGNDPPEALAQLRDRPETFDVSFVNALEDLSVAAPEVRALKVSELQAHMVLDENVLSVDGRLVTTKGEEVTSAMLERLKNWAQRVGIVEPVRVLVPQ